jgi:hypothetical protein
VRFILTRITLVIVVGASFPSPEYFPQFNDHGIWEKDITSEPTLHG